jgi:transcriptional regulator with XRE-family HTH domain
MATPREKDPLTSALGSALARARTQASLTQERLAYLCGLHPTTVSQMERGINSPTVRALHRIARQLGTTPSALLATAEQQLDDTVVSPPNPK